VSNDYSSKIQTRQGADVFFVASGGTTQTDAGVGAVAGAGSTAIEYGNDVVHKTVITLDALAVVLTDAGAAGSQGTAKIYDFPAGLIVVLGAICDLTTLAGAGGVADTGALVGAVGSATVGAADATLTGTEANLIASTAGTLTGGAGTLKGEGAAVAFLDGTGTAADAYLNLAVPDAGSAADDTVTVSGTVTLVWFSPGDN
jgi:hypothetical protein